VLGALGLVVLTGALVFRDQITYRYLSDINWPGHFPVANSLAWLAVLLLAADAVIVAVRLHAARSDGEDGRPDRGPAPDAHDDALPDEDRSDVVH
jgi:hypothetical protein